MRLALATSLALLRRCVAMSAAPKAKVVVLAGPTAVGKSAAALELCRSLGGEIVSADSVQLYRGLDIGANKPSAADMAAVRHHLVDAGDPAAPWSAGEWCRAAVAAVDDVAARGGGGRKAQAFVFAASASVQASLNVDVVHA